MSVKKPHQNDQFEQCLPSMWPSFQTRNRMSAIKRSRRGRIKISGSTRSMPKVSQFILLSYLYMLFKTRFIFYKVFLILFIVFVSFWRIHGGWLMLIHIAIFDRGENIFFFQLLHSDIFLRSLLTFIFWFFFYNTIIPCTMIRTLYNISPVVIIIIIL